MLAKLIKKALYLQPEGISEEELKKDGYKEYIENEMPKNLPKTQQAVCKLEDTGNKIVMSWDIVPAQPEPTVALQGIQKQAVIEQIAENEDKTLGIKCMSVIKIQISARQNTRRRGLSDKKGK